MIRRILLSTLLSAGALSLCAEPAVPHAVAFPSTTLVFGEVHTAAMGHDKATDEALDQLLDRFDIPTLPAILTKEMRLSLSDEHARVLGAGAVRMSAGLLDVGLAGPRWQFVVEYADREAVRALGEALAKARGEKSRHVPKVEDHFGVPIYSVYWPEPGREVQPGGWGFQPRAPGRPEDAWVALVGQRFVVIGSSRTATGDAVDALQTPDDLIDTLAGNRRYRDATREFDDPMALLFVNGPALINLIERVGGDGQSNLVGMILFEMFSGMVDIDDPRYGPFVANLVQYEQLNSIVAALWHDSSTRSVKIEFAVDFINAPGWLDAIRGRPQPRRLASRLPADTMFYKSFSVNNAAERWSRAREFLASRARNAGLRELAEEVEAADEELRELGIDLDELLGLFEGEQAVVVLPDRDAHGWGMPEVALVFSLGDRKGFENLLFEKLLPVSLDEIFGEVEHPFAPVEFVHGAEVHASMDKSVAFCIVGDDDGRGIFMFGQYGALIRIVTEGKEKPLSGLDAWRDNEKVQGLVADGEMFFNFGVVMKHLRLDLAFADFDFDDGVEELQRDDTAADEDMFKPVIELFQSTLVSVMGLLEERRFVGRAHISGLPSDADAIRLAYHLRDVDRNREVRDDLVYVRDAALAHFVLQGECATDVRRLLDEGYLADERNAFDAFDETGRRAYGLAVVPRDVDVRQPILLAYQTAPGLRGNHLCVLFNGHVVALTPEGLAAALARAEQGLRVEEDMYAVPISPVHTTDLRPRQPTRMGQVEILPRPAEREVVVIGKDGEEERVRVVGEDAKTAAMEAERHLDRESVAPEDEE